MLTEKLKERIKPFMNASKPGDEKDLETIAFKEKMQKEADDLKIESFGVEVCILHLLAVPLILFFFSFRFSRLD